MCADLSLGRVERLPGQGLLLSPAGALPDEALLIMCRNVSQLDRKGLNARQSPLEGAVHSHSPGLLVRQPVTSSERQSRVYARPMALGERR